MSKRVYPFNSCSPLQLKTHVETKHVNNNEASMKEIYAKTQNLMKAGAKAQSQKASVQSDIQRSNVCENCKKASESLQFAKCSFCNKKICVYCFNVCSNCEQNFCPLCSVLSYDDREGKAYCLSCTCS